MGYVPESDGEPIGILVWPMLAMICGPLGAIIGASLALCWARYHRNSQGDIRISHSVAALDDIDELRSEGGTNFEQPQGPFPADG